MEREFGWIYRLIFSFWEEALDKQKDVIWTFNGDEEIGMMSAVSIWKVKTTLFKKIQSSTYE